MVRRQDFFLEQAPWHDCMAAVTPGISCQPRFSQLLPEFGGCDFVALCHWPCGWVMVPKSDNCVTLHELLSGSVAEAPMG